MCNATLAGQIPGDPDVAAIFCFAIFAIFQKTCKIVCNYLKNCKRVCNFFKTCNPIAIFWKGLYKTGNFIKRKYEGLKKLKRIAKIFAIFSLREEVKSTVSLSQNPHSGGRNAEHGQLDCAGWPGP